MDKNRKSDLEQIMIEDEEILEKYFEIQMKDKIGEGAFGIVMRGIDMQDNKVCAIKVIQYLHLFKVVKKASNEYNQIETSILSSLRHQNIILFKRFCETKRVLYIVMELLTGGTL